MKHGLILILSISSLLNCMEPEKKYTIRKWDAQEYHKGCDFQTNSFLHFLKTNNITIKNRHILDMGCGTCRIAKELSPLALHIHCVDASPTMIEFAQQNTPHDIKNITHEISFAEEFLPSHTLHKANTQPNLYNLAIMSSAFHWLQNKKKALKKIYASLEDNGEFFADILTSDNPIPFNLKIFNQLKEENTLLKKTLATNPQNPIGSSYPSLDELKNMFNTIGFTIIKAEEQSYNTTMTKQEFIQLQLPIMKSRPFAEQLSAEEFNSVFNDFINMCLTQLEKTTDNKYKYPFTTTIIHTKKILL